jgi:hypothetical protein
LRSPGAWTGGAGGADKSIALAERPRASVTKAAAEAAADVGGADMVRVGGGC